MKHLSGHNYDLESISDLCNYHHLLPGFPISSPCLQASFDTGANHTLLRKVKNKATKLEYWSYWYPEKKKILENYSQTSSKTTSFSEGRPLKTKTHLLPLSFSPTPKRKKKNYGVRAILINWRNLDKFGFSLTAAVVSFSALMKFIIWTCWLRSITWVFFCLQLLILTIWIQFL